ncbi:group II intron maturase-specific domain-containing protein [Bacillus chungangensis]|nr:group II intron maturase-specific domain-containing protein [Bacillus chungangensis]
MNPVIRGWGNYYRKGSCTEALQQTPTLDSKTNMEPQI